MLDWSNNEVDFIISDYFSMLEKELAGKDYNKTQHRNTLVKILNNRSDGSIEFKHQNISAVLVKLGLPFIRGYKPLYNYQRILEDRVIDFLNNQRQDIEDRFNKFANDSNISSVECNFNDILESPPVKQLVSGPEISYERRPIKINYLQREQNNIMLGEKGEVLVIEFEKWNLIKQGKDSYADSIEWISKNDDGVGFDILSKNLNGTDKYIEVKTTKLSKDAPIFFTKNEYEFSLEKADNYHLYRVFNFDKMPKIFQLSGNFDAFCMKEAVQYKGTLGV